MRFITIAVLVGLSLQAQDVITNETVIRMVAAGVPSNAIIQSINNSPTVNFTMGPGALQALGQARVPNEVIVAMLARTQDAPQSQPAKALAQQQPPPQAPAPPPVRAAVVGSPDDRYQDGGMWDVNFQASAAFPHESSSDYTALATGTLGYFASRGNEIGVGATILRLPVLGGTSITSVQGVYRFYFPTSGRAIPYFGAGAGLANVRLLGVGETRFAASANAGVRVFVARRIGIDVNYVLQYIRVPGFGFQSSSSSGLAIGFAHVFGGR